MDIDKSVNPAPMGLPQTDAFGADVSGPPEMEVILADTDDEEDIAAMLQLAEEAEEAFDEEEEFYANMAEDMDEDELNKLASSLMEDFTEDVASRQDWIKMFADGLELLGLKIEERTEPWENACGVHHPLLSEAVVKFQAEAMMETFPAQGPVKVKIIGEETVETRAAATRVQADMNYQLTEVMTEYRPEHERMLWGLGLAGNAFKKVYFDPSLDRQVAMYIPAEDVVVPYGASNIETAERVTHVMRKTPNEVKKMQRDGFYREVELDEPTDCLDEVEKTIAENQGLNATSDDRHKLLEMHVDLIIEDDDFRDKDDEGIALPYVVTLDKSSQTVLSIRRNWTKGDQLKRKRNHFVHYSYIPGFGFYAFGLIHLVGGFAKSGTSLIRQLVDAGTLSNLPGGFKTKGLRVKGDDTPIGPAEWRDVDIASGTMRDNIMPLPYKEPSQVLFMLLQNIVEEGRRFASIADMKISDMSAQAPVGTTLAILERTLKVMSAVQARVHYAMRQEFRLLRDIIREHTDDSYDYDPVGPAGPRAKKADYDKVEVIPVSDPNAATMAQKIVQYQAVIQLAQMAPQVYDIPHLHRQMLEVLGIQNPEKLVPLEDEDEIKPADPVSENMNVLNGKPVKAFIYQDHQAHIAVHMAAMQDPKIAALMGQNPNAQAIMAAANAHIAEHLAFEYRKQIEETAGVPLPAPDTHLDETTELEISRLAAAAAEKLLAKNQLEAQQQQQQEQAQDPILQMQQMELQIKQQQAQLKEQELELKKQAEENRKMKNLMDAADKADRNELEREKIEAQKEIAGLNAGVRIATTEGQIGSKEQIEGLKAGMQAAREAMAIEEQEEQSTPTAPPEE